MPAMEVASTEVAATELASTEVATPRVTPAEEEADLSAEAEYLEQEAQKLEKEAERLSSVASQPIETGASNVCPVTAETFLGNWTDTLGHNVLVVRVAEDKPDLLKAILTKPGVMTKVLMIKMDRNLQCWTCGNGFLDLNRLVFDDHSGKAKPLEISWAKSTGQYSTWTREKSWSDVAKALNTASGDLMSDTLKTENKATPSPQPHHPFAKAVLGATGGGMFVGQWKAYWNNSIGHDVNVTLHGDISQGLPKATITKADGSFRELLIVIDKKYGVWKCGNGWLGDYIEYDNDQAITLTWIDSYGRMSTWNREVDHSSTDAGTEDNLKETWWNMTEEWENEKKCAIKKKIKNEKNQADKQQNGNQDYQKATTRNHKNANQWVEVTAKTQKAASWEAPKASRGARKNNNNTQSSEIGARKWEDNKGSRRQQKA